MLYHESASENIDFALSEEWEREALSGFQGGYKQTLHDTEENDEPNEE